MDRRRFTRISHQSRRAVFRAEFHADVVIGGDLFAEGETRFEINRGVKASGGLQIVVRNITRPRGRR